MRIRLRHNWLGRVGTRAEVCKTRQCPACALDGPSERKHHQSRRPQADGQPDGIACGRPAECLCETMTSTRVLVVSVCVVVRVPVEGSTRWAFCWAPWWCTGRRPIPCTAAQRLRMWSAVTPSTCLRSIPDPGRAWLLGETKPRNLFHLRVFAPPTDGGALLSSG